MNIVPIVNYMNTFDAATREQYRRQRNSRFESNLTRYGHPAKIIDYKQIMNSSIFLNIEKYSFFQKLKYGPFKMKINN